jgi:hypothetical protein
LSRLLVLIVRLVETNKSLKGKSIRPEIVSEEKVH